MAIPTPGHKIGLHGSGATGKGAVQRPLPLWFGAGPMWQPLAIALIFGLIFATVLTLRSVPVMYSLLYRVSFKGFTYRG